MDGPEASTWLDLGNVNIGATFDSAAQQAHSKPFCAARTDLHWRTTRQATVLCWPRHLSFLWPLPSGRTVLETNAENAMIDR
jgi:hypothetical protein